MIYFKIDKKVFSGEYYPIVKQYHKRFWALYRVLNRALKNELKDYPAIDIILSDKNIHHTLGTFYHNNKGYFRDKKEYSFIKQHTGNPYIVLFIQPILRFYKQNNVKGFLSILFHEYGHFKEWLLNQSHRHNKQHKRFANASADKHLEDMKNYCKLT